MSGPTIGIDIGQSGSRARSADPAAPREVSGPGYWSAPAAGIVRDLVLALAPAPGARLRLGVGLSGYEAQTGQARAMGEALEQAGHAARVALADDGLTAYLGALGLAAGGMVAAGTGSVALALDPGAGLARVDGWGAELGDHGSGYWIGREAIRRGLRLYDEGRQDGLVSRLIAHWGPLDTIAARWRTRRPGIEEIAAFARPVIALAHDGNAASRAILEDAARQLAGSLAMALRRAGLAERPVPVTGLGGIFAAGEIVSAPFAAALLPLVPAARHTAPQGDPLAGCIRLAGLAPDPVLRPLFETYGD